MSRSFPSSGISGIYIYSLRIKSLFDSINSLISFPLKSLFFVYNLTIITPKLNMSLFVIISSLSNNSGARYPGDPQMLLENYLDLIANPKSIIFTCLLLSIIIFSNLISR